MASASKSRGAPAERMIPAARSISSSQVVEWDNGALRRADDYLAAEEPLEIRVGRHSLGVTMRTPGHDQELAAGLLLTQGVVTQRSQIAEIREAAQTNIGCRVLVAGRPTYAAGQVDIAAASTTIERASPAEARA